MSVPPKGWDKIEGDFTEPVRKAQFYNDMACKAAFDKELKYIDKVLTKAAQQGFFIAKVGVITDVMTRHLESLGFVVNEDGVDTHVLF